MSTLFSKDVAVVALVSKLLIIVGITELGNAPQLLTGGILKGPGRPSIAAWLGIVTYYELALPLAAFFAFHLDWEVLGLWWALVFAQAFKLAMLGVFVLIQDWHELAKAAMNLAHDQGKHGFALGVPQSKLDRVHSMGRRTC
jgi:MATE family multidrug resistance protein